MELIKPAIPVTFIEMNDNNKREEMSFNKPHNNERSPELYIFVYRINNFYRKILAKMNDEKKQ